MTRAFKKSVWKEVELLLSKKRRIIESELKSAREAGNNETKSSAGDKHETGRALAQLEQENLSLQLVKQKELEYQFQKLNPKSAFLKAQAGSLVDLNSFWVLLGISLGNINVEGETVFAVSLKSPMGQQLIGKSVGEGFSLNGQEFKINQLY